MNRTTWLTGLVVLSFAASPPAHAQDRAKSRQEPIDPAGIARLVADSGGSARVSINEATGAARFVKAAPGRKLGLLRRAEAPVSVEAKKGRSAEFFEAYGGIFGITDAVAQLEAVRVVKDRQGGTHITYRQVHHGVPVFAAELRTHFDAAHELAAVNGTFIPDIDVDHNPARSAGEAARTAVAKVEADLSRPGQLSARETSLLVFREGLAKGVRGPNHLAWKVEVADGVGVREFVFVDAHTGKFVDQITGAPDALDRKAYETTANFPNNPFWVEGDPFPTGDAEANNVIDFSGDAYGLYSAAFGRDSFDAAGGTMHGVFRRTESCPNASWNGVFTSYCAGVSSDDVVAHEWTHAYTQYTHNLIYQWQPGALNESYSDIYGEVVDFINGKGTDVPGGPRSDGACTVFTTLPGVVTINAPPSIAGDKATGSAAFGPQNFDVTNDVVLVDDGVGVTSDACQSPFVNAGAVAGRIALLDRGTCAFTVKVKNAQDNGAVGVIVANNVPGVLTMGGADPTIVIPALMVGLADGNAIKAELPATTVNARLRRGGTGTDNSYRWLVGEDSSAFGGAIRDMWTPPCYGDPGKVLDVAYYVCSTSDNGGVHSNSGIPNHAFALVTDGGSYNGQAVGGIGLTKAAHVYFRAMSVYQHSATDFADHADALDQSCSDLIGVNLADLSTGAPSGQVITAGDCDQVAAAAAAVELRTPPAFCNFQPLLAQNPPPLCSGGGFATPLFHDDFDNGNSSSARWSVSHEGVTADFTPRDWEVVSNLPDDRAGQAFFGSNPDIGTCAPGGDESGVMYLASPRIAIPASITDLQLTFDHWVATEPAFDGGNLKISVNGGPWQLVQAADFVYNAYNTTLAAAPQNTNPLAGQQAFSGTDGGAVDGSWGRSIVNLAPYAQPKDKIQLRFEMGSDGCTGRFGWYIDDLMVYKCH